MKPPCASTRRSVPRTASSTRTPATLRPAAVVGYKLVPVFHQGQLAAPPDLPGQPKLLSGEDPPVAVWDAIAEQITAAGYTLRRGPLDGPDGAKGVTNFPERTVTVRDDLGPAQSLKTQIHELGHVLMHADVAREPGMARDRIEVEAESVAYVVCDILGVDAGDYSIPYVANWAGADVQLVQDTAHRVLTTARTHRCRTRSRTRRRPSPEPHRPSDHRTAAARQWSGSCHVDCAVDLGTTDQIITDHLTTGPFDWQRLAAAIPALEAERARGLDRRPAQQVIVLAEAGASAEANVDVLHAQGVGDEAVAAILTALVPDAVGARATLYTTADVDRALRNPRTVRPVVEAIVADLLVSTGRHPAALRQLAESTGQPSSVVDLAEERMRRAAGAGRHREPRALGHRRMGHAERRPRHHEGPSPTPDPPAA